MTPTTTVPRHLWTRTFRRLAQVKYHELNHEQRIALFARYEAVHNARRGTR